MSRQGHRLAAGPRYLANTYPRTPFAVEPIVIARYFGEGVNRPRAVPVEAFFPGRGWQPVQSQDDGGMVTIAFAKRMRREGATHVCVAVGTRRPDFTIAELLTTDAGAIAS